MAGSPRNTTFNLFSGLTLLFLRSVKSSHNVFLLTLMQMGLPGSKLFWSCVINYMKVCPSVLPPNPMSFVSDVLSSTIIASGVVVPSYSMYQLAHMSAWSTICSTGKFEKHVGRQILQTNNNAYKPSTA